MTALSQIATQTARVEAQRAKLETVEQKLHDLMRVAHEAGHPYRTIAPHTPYCYETVRTIIKRRQET